MTAPGGCTDYDTNLAVTRVSEPAKNAGEEIGMNTPNNLQIHKIRSMNKKKTIVDNGKRW